LDLVIEAAAALDIRYVVIPLVDNGRLENPEQTEVLHRLLMQRHATLLESNVHIAFESDYAPDPLLHFISLFPADRFGINYDIGNSASMGFAPAEEIAMYGQRITNVHVKDRVLGGTTVPLGTGAANMQAVFSGLKLHQYPGNFILQTARAIDGNHEAILSNYLAWTLEQLERHFGP